MKVVAKRAVNDPEKAVLPALVWCRKSDSFGAVYFLAIGWWDWHLALLWSRTLKKPRMTNQLNRETGERR